jgi:GNAT superfamily N-acetyltransferase
MVDNTYEIRPAKAGESEAIYELWVGLHAEQAELDARSGLSEDAAERWENDYPVWLEEDEDYCFLTAVDGTEEIVGFIHAELWYPPPTETPSQEVYVNALYVSPEHRHQGVGSRLVAGVKDWARERDLDQLRFGVLHANEEGRYFWEAHGATTFVDVMTVQLE